MKKIGVLIIMIGVIGMVMTGKDFFSREKIQQELYFPKSQFDHIMVKGGMGNVRVLPSSSDEIEVSWKGKLFKSKFSQDLVSVEENDTELKINFGEHRFFYISFFNFSFLNSLELTIHLPEKQYNSLTVKTDVGNAYIEGIEVNHLTAETDVANMTIKQVKSKEAVMRTDVGKMSLNNVTGKLNAESDVGNIVVQTDEITDDMTLSSDVGRIQLTIPEIPDNVSFNGESSVGSVKIFDQKGSNINYDADYIVKMSTDVGSIKVSAKK